MARQMAEDDKVYRAVVVYRWIMHSSDRAVESIYHSGVWTSRAQARAQATRLSNQVLNSGQQEIIDAYVEVADNWTRIQ